MALIPARLSGSGPVAPDPGVEFFVDFDGTTNPGVTQTVISVTVPAAKVLRLRLVSVRCTMDGKFEILEDGSVIGSGYTGAASLNVDFFYAPDRSLSAGTQIDVKFLAHPATGATDLEAFLMGRLTD